MTVLRSERNQCAAFGLDTRKASADRKRLLFRSERILPAGIQDNKAHFIGGADRVEDLIERNAFLRNIGVVFEFRIDWNEIIAAIEFDAVPGK